MRVLVAGATGAIGKRLIPLLVSAGHQVTAMTRTSAKAAGLSATGAQPIIADALDAESVSNAVKSVRPDAVVHQMTALASMRDLRHFDREFELTNRLRTEGTEHLLRAAQAVGTQRFIAQSYCGWPSGPKGNRVMNEEEPLDNHPPRAMSRTLEAIRRLEQMVTGAGGLTGIVLRYGSFYGPGTSLGESGVLTEAVRHRKFPLVGNGAGVWSFIHMDDAAQATLLALENAPAGIYNIVDDEPAEVSVWLPQLARTLGAKPPFRLPGWLARLAVGEAGMVLMTQARGCSNAKAKRVLDWRLCYPSWRDGFAHGLHD